MISVKPRLCLCSVSPISTSTFGNSWTLVSSLPKFPFKYSCLVNVIYIFPSQKLHFFVIWSTSTHITACYSFPAHVVPCITSFCIFCPLPSLLHAIQCAPLYTYTCYSKLKSCSSTSRNLLQPTFCSQLFFQVGLLQVKIPQMSLCAIISHVTHFSVVLLLTSFCFIAFSHTFFTLLFFTQQNWNVSSSSLRTSYCSKFSALSSLEILHKRLFYTTSHFSTTF